MRVLELWRYPVKSLRGERLDALTATAAGFDGDRRFAIFDATTGFGLTARRVPALLTASARLRPDGGVEIILEDGSVADGDEALSAWVGRPVTLKSSDDTAARRYENPVDFERESSGWEPFDGARGAFHDSGRAAVSLVSTAALASWAAPRFRANVLLDGADEESLVGSRVRLGEVMLDVRKRLERCVMVTRPQPGGIERDLDVLRTIHRERDGCLAVGALVTEPGTVRVGDVLRPTSR